MDAGNSVKTRALTTGLRPGLHFRNDPELDFLDAPAALVLGALLITSRLRDRQSTSVMSLRPLSTAAHYNTPSHRISGR